MMRPGSNPAVGAREGDVLAGKYRVERVLGVGGMGVVVSAHHIHLDEKVALKFLRPEALGNVEATSRFAREARAAVRIKSEHVARVIDVGTLEDGAPYMVMEYLEGGDLAAWLKSRGALPIEQAVEFILQTCVAVADAHALGIVHRDLKPANLFCVRRSDGQLSIKVLDFGISKMSEAGGGTPESITRTSALMGSPLYMSPEQMRSSKDVDALTDIWSLGVILYELMAGHPAFRGESLTELVLMVTNDPAPPVRATRPEVPSGLEAVVFKCLEKDKRRRFQNVAELAKALLPFAPPRTQGLVDRIHGIIEASGLSVRAVAEPPSPLATTQAPAPGLETGTGLGNTKNGGRQGVRPLLAVVGVIAGLSLVLALVLALVARGRVARGDGAQASTSSAAAGAPQVSAALRLPETIPTASAPGAQPTPSAIASASASASASAALPGYHGLAVPTAPPGSALPRKAWKPSTARPSTAASPQDTQEHDVY